jgi:hypothetical protein
MTTCTKTIQRFILFLLILLFVVGCREPDSQPAVTTAQYPVETTASVPVTIGKPEPTPTTAVCTPLLADMTLDIQYESDLHGTIKVTGLQSSETPIVLITGDSVTGSYREESTAVQEVGADGRFQHTFNFRSWPSVEGYTFKGQLIHQRGVACFDLEIPQTDEAGEAGRTINGRLVAAEDETQSIPGVLLRLEAEGQPVAQTNGNGRFTIQNAPLTALRLYTQRLDYAIPAGTETALDLGDVPYPPLQSLILAPADYPPRPIPYWIEEGDFWLAHMPEGQLFAFAPLSPPYAADIDIDECRYIWDESGQRFIDPCSGDEWEIDGRLNLEHSPELWSKRDLDQYGIHAIEDVISVQFSPLISGLLVDEPPLAVDAQNGITITAVNANFSPESAIIDTLILVDPLWQMDPTTFPPQQALTYFTMPDSLIDDQGRSTAPTSREGEPAVYDSSTSAFRQLMHNRWRPIAADADTVTATLTIELLNLTRQINVPLDWDAHQVGDVWDVDVPLEIGYTEAKIQQIEWLEPSPNVGDDGSARLRLTVTDASPDDIHLYCLYLETSALDERTCPNFEFEGELTYMVDVQPGEPVTLHLLAALALERPFTLVLDVVSSE